MQLRTSLTALSLQPGELCELSESTAQQPGPGDVGR